MIKRELLNEQKVVSGYNLYIGVFPVSSRPDYLKDPYFKVYIGKNPKSASEISRISILRPEYVIHRNNDGKKNVKLSKTQLGFVLKLLRDPISGNTTGWEFMIKFLLIKAKEDGIIIPYDNNLQMPDYTQLK